MQSHSTHRASPAPAAGHIEVCKLRSLGLKQLLWGKLNNERNLTARKVTSGSKGPDSTQQLRLVSKVNFKTRITNYTLLQCVRWRL